MSVLNQAQSNASQSHRLEFTVKSAEELNTVMEELNACDSGTTLQNSVRRFGFIEKRYNCQLQIFYSFSDFHFLFENVVWELHLFKWNCLKNEISDPVSASLTKLLFLLLARNDSSMNLPHVWKESQSGSQTH